MQRAIQSSVTYLPVPTVSYYVKLFRHASEYRKCVIDSLLDLAIFSGTVTRTECCSNESSSGTVLDETVPVFTSSPLGVLAGIPHADVLVFYLSHFHKDHF